MGKMSDLSLALQGIKEICESAPDPNCSLEAAPNVLHEYDRRIGRIFCLARDIEKTLSSTT